MIKLDEIKREVEMDEFDYDEQRGRDYVAGWIAALKGVELIEFHPLKMGAYDVAYISGGTKCIGEIKFRKYNHTAYPDWILQEDKYNKLKAISNRRGDIKIHYLNVFKDGQMFIWDLTDADMGEPSTALLSSTTSVDKGQRNKETYYVNSIDTIYKTTD